MRSRSPILNLRSTSLVAHAAAFIRRSFQAAFASRMFMFMFMFVLAPSVAAQAQTATAPTGTSTAAAGDASKDPATATALLQTQNLLRDKAAREKSMTSADAKGTDKQVKDLMGSDTQSLYELAADILPTIIADGGGDSIKIQASLSEMMKNPDSFAAKLTPDQLSKLKDLAKRAEARQPATTAH